MHVITKVAPLGAFGAMAFTIGKYGLGLAGAAAQADRHLLLHRRSSSWWWCWVRWRA
ncbi:hypothetical protein ACU4GD_39150 [Cupriavidus basilensis]